MKKYKNNSTKKITLCFILLLFFGSVLGWLEHRDFSKILNAWEFAVPYFSVFLLIDYFFTYLKIDPTTRQVTALSFLYSQNRVKIDRITRITKEPHPVFKAWSWAIFIHYKNEKGKEKHFEIWPSFNEQTMGKFLSELEKLNSKIQFDEGCKEWIEKYGKS